MSTSRQFGPPPDAASPPNLIDGTLLILSGAGHSKPGLFKAAMSRGLRIVLVKQDLLWENDYCDDVLSLDCRNYENLAPTVSKIVAFARDHGANGVITTFDAAIPALAEVARQLGLVGITPETASILRNKLLMRQRFAELGLPSAKSIHAHNWGEAVSAAEHIGYPVVIKPIMGTGSAGVLLAADGCELADAYERARRAGLMLNGTSELVVEEYLDGVEVCVDALVHRGTIVFQNITDHPEVMSGPLFEGAEYVTPSRLDDHMAKQVYEVNRRTIEGLGLTDGIAHTEIRVTRHGPRLIETHPRIAGHRLPEITRRAIGVDLFGAAIDIAMNVRPAIAEQRRGHASYRCVCSPRSGMLRAIRGIDEALRLPGIFDIEVLAEAGNEVTALPDAIQQNLAFILADGKTYEAVRQRTEAALALIDVEVA